MNKYIEKLVTLLPFKNYSLNERTQKRQKELQEDFIKQLYNLGGSLSFEDALKQKSIFERYSRRTGKGDRSCCFNKKKSLQVRS